MFVIYIFVFLTASQVNAPGCVIRGELCRQLCYAVIKSLSAPYALIILLKFACFVIAVTILMGRVPRVYCDD